MKKAILHIICLFFILPVFAQYTVKGGKGQLLAKEEAPMKVYLLNGLAGAEISYTSQEEGAHQWYKYNKNANEAIPVSCRQNEKTSVITDIDDGWGYFVGLTISSTTSYVWIIDYSTKQPSFLNFYAEEEEDKCEFLKLITDVEAEPLEYYTNLGALMTLPRKYHLLYDDLKWNESDLSFIPEKKDITLTGVLSEIVIDAPLKTTEFRLTGDEYAKSFNMERELKIPEYIAVALEVHSIATKFNEIGEDEKTPGGNTDVLNYSAPVTISFDAYANDVASMYIWEVKKINPVTKDSVTIMRDTQKSLTCPFEESGNFIARLEVTGRPQSSCVDKTQYFRIFIGDSDLKLPNVFSPGSSFGVNDEYKVSYKSLISFKASIYNRWGNLLYQWNDPAKGWDGRVNGKFVPTGVYFIVVEAKGADGKSYKLSKDINVLRSKNN